MQLEINPLVARELHQLSNVERNILYDELHGVTSESKNNLQSKQDQNIVQDCLVRMEEEIQKIHPKKRKAYNQAHFLAPVYLKSDRFRIMFLRATQSFDGVFCPKLAAEQIVNHFEMKLELFGPEVLGRPVRISDLSVDDMETVKSGFLQPLLPDAINSPLFAQTFTLALLLAVNLFDNQLVNYVRDY